MLLKYGKVAELGFEPALFVPGKAYGCSVVAHWGWDDGGQHLDGNSEYSDSEFDKRLFISAFNEQYPLGLIVDEDYRDYRRRTKKA
jgi:hypothetical protein